MFSFFKKKKNIEDSYIGFMLSKELLSGRYTAKIMTLLDNLEKYLITPLEDTEKKWIIANYNTIAYLHQVIDIRADSLMSFYIRNEILATIELLNICKEGATWTDIAFRLRPYYKSSKSITEFVKRNIEAKILVKKDSKYYINQENFSLFLNLELLSLFHEEIDNLTILLIILEMILSREKHIKPEFFDMAHKKIMEIYNTFLLVSSLESSSKNNIFEKVMKGEQIKLSEITAFSITDISMLYILIEYITHIEASLFILGRVREKYRYYLEKDQEEIREIALLKKMIKNRNSK